VSSVENKWSLLLHFQMSLLSSLSKRCARLAGCVALLLGISGQTLRAQEPTLVDDPELQRRHDAAFAALFARPSDEALIRSYAEIATRLGDVEAAIGAYERLLYANPDSPAARRELGRLYFRLTAYQMARGYFGSTDPAGGLEGARNAFLLSEIERRLPTPGLSVSIETGARYQSNANAGPSASLIRALGFDTALPVTASRRRDGNAYGLVSLGYIHDLGTPRGDVVEAQVTGFYARQFALQSLNTGLVEASLGPRLMLGNALPGWSIKPYALAGFVTLGDKPYIAHGGGGVVAAMPVGHILFEPGIEWRRRAFRASGDQPTATEQTGALTTSWLTASGFLASSLRWTARGFYQNNDAREAFNAFAATGGDVGLIWQVEPPVLTEFGSWSIFSFVGMTRTAYDAANPSVDPAVRRKDREWRVGTKLNLPLWTNGGLGLLVQYTTTRSNLPNFRMRNLAVTVGPTVRF